MSGTATIEVLFELCEVQMLKCVVMISGPEEGQEKLRGCRLLKASSEAPKVLSLGMFKFNPFDRK